MDDQHIANPDVSLSEPLGHWPTSEELDALYALRGKTDRDVLRTIGHPKAIEDLGDSISRWQYDWPTACYVDLNNMNKVVHVYYTAGY